MCQQLQARERSVLIRPQAPVGITQSERQNKSPELKRSHQAASELANVSKRVEKGNACIFCSSNDHDSLFCKEAELLTVEQKRNSCKRLGACFRCLKIGHMSSLCKNKIKCTFCGLRHLKIMCFKRDRDEIKEKTVENSALTNNSSFRSVVLQTLIVNISENGENHYVRIIIDTGSSKSYISKFIAKRLKLKCFGQESVLHGLFGGVEKKENHKKYIVHLSNVSKGFQFEMKVMDQDIICSSIPKLNNEGCLKKLKGYGIFPSDVTINENCCLYDKDPNEIHILVGADYAGKLFTGEIKHLTEYLVAMNTHLGWTVMGGTGKEQKCSEGVLVSLHVSERKLCDLWSLDSLGITEPTLSQTKQEREKATENHFISSLRGDSEGRYEVSLPWLEVHPDLPDNRVLAEKRLKSCVKTLQTKNCLEDYENVLKEWLKEEVIEPVDILEDEKSKCHYLPHRAVFRENSTTKIRPVFDASAKEKNSVCLNDCLEKGPNYLELIPRILNRFREGNYGVISDIRRAFLQISLNPVDRDFLRFLWWEKGNTSKLRIYRHRRVVFGVNASPFLLAATINHHLKNVPQHQQKTAVKLKEAMYVDNCVASVESIEELNCFISESKEIMAAGKFDLRGWKYNKPINKTSILNQSDENYEEIVSVLGLKWNLFNDTLSCELQNEQNHTLSKRTILSALSKIFDPIGFTSPVTLIPKLILQECWKHKINWDADLPTDLAKRFLKWSSQLKYLKEIEIPRQLPKIDEGTSLHIFCDASKNAYATCIFLRHSYGDYVDCQLVQSKARVAPIKSITIPRLEILACTIGVRLAHVVKEDLKIKEIPIFYWTDSMNALFWIKRTENWATFVANRVNEIRSLSRPEDWHHIPGKLNPADLPSRGCCAKELKESEWWKGPRWIYLPPEKWSSTNEETPDLDIVNAEKRISVVSTNTNTNLTKSSLFDNISSYEKIVKVVSWIYRFVKNATIDPSNRTYGRIIVEEIKGSETVLFRLIQKESFEGLHDKRIRALS